MICEYSSWLAFMVPMLRISDDCLCFDGCERHKIALLTEQDKDPVRFICF